MSDLFEFLTALILVAMVGELTLGLIRDKLTAAIAIIVMCAVVIFVFK